MDVWSVGYIHGPCIPSSDSLPCTTLTPSTDYRPGRHRDARAAAAIYLSSNRRKRRYHLSCATVPVATAVRSGPATSFVESVLAGLALRCHCALTLRVRSAQSSCDPTAASCATANPPHGATCWELWSLDVYTCWSVGQEAVEPWGKGQGQGARPAPPGTRHHRDGQKYQLSTREALIVGSQRIDRLSHRTDRSRRQVSRSLPLAHA